MRRLKPKGKNNFLKEASLHSFLLYEPPFRSVEAPGRLPAAFPAAACGRRPVFSAPESLPRLPVKTLPRCRIQHRSAIALSCLMRMELLLLCVHVAL